MTPGSIDSLERMTPAELIGLVRGLIGEVTRVREENEKLSAALAGQRVENQILKDEIARLKHLPARPPHKPSGMEKATEGPERGGEGEKDEASKRRRGPGVSKLSIDREMTLRVEAPVGSRFPRAMRRSPFRTGWRRPRPRFVGGSAGGRRTAKHGLRRAGRGSWAAAARISIVWC